MVMRRKAYLRVEWLMRAIAGSRSIKFRKTREVFGLVGKKKRSRKK